MAKIIWRSYVEAAIAARRLKTKKLENGGHRGSVARAWRQCGIS